MTKKETIARNSLIGRLLAFFLTFFLVVALIINLSGFRGPIQFDNTYYSFMQRASIEASSWGISIPRIPTIEYGDNVNSGFDIIGVLVRIGNFFINFMNIIISALNLVISLFTTFSAIIKLLFDFGEQDFSTSGDLSYWVENASVLITI